MFPISTSHNSVHDYSQWPTKQQAADALEVATKTIEVLHREGKLQMVLWKRPSGGPKISVYHPVDVERERRLRFPDQVSSFVMPAPSQTSQVGSEISASTVVPVPTSTSGISASTAEISASNPHAISAESIAMLLRALQEALAESSAKLLSTSQKESEKPQKSRLEVPLHLRVFLTVPQAAAYTGYPQRRVRQWIADGTLQADTEGYTRVKRSDLDALTLHSCTRPVVTVPSLE